MKKSLLLLTTVLSFGMSGIFAAAPELGDVGEGVGVHDVVVSIAAGESSRAVASTADLERIKAHIRGYGATLGLPDKVKAVGKVGCSAWCSTTFESAERFLLNEFAGQLLTRFIAIALDDLADGKLDGIAYGKKVSYAQEVAALLGVSVSEEELKAVPLDEGLAVRLLGLGLDVTSKIIQTGGQKDLLIASASAFAKEKMEKARKSLAVALIQETDRIISLELGNGAIDGLDVNGIAIDWKKEMQDSIQRALSRVLDGVL